MDPMSTPTKISSFRRERSWIARAMSSFPVPFSPKIKTLASVEATLSMMEKIFFMEADWPIISV